MALKKSPKYHMTQLRSFAMIDTAEAFWQGASAFRNARDWAKENRDELIVAANVRVKSMLSELSTTEEINEDENHCWSLHLQVVNDLTLHDPTTSSLSLLTAYQAILARTTCSLTDNQLPLPHEYYWLGSENSDELERVNGIIGI